MISNGVINLFNYCNNNCVSSIDRNGYSPELIITAAIFGGAIIYNKYLKSFNCYSYAMGEYGIWLHPGKGKINVSKNGVIINDKYLMPKFYTIDQMLDWVIKDFGKKVVRKLKNSKDKLKKGEYRVAVRIQKIYISGKFRHTRNFHFMKQDPSTKKWWDKPGKSAIECLGKINPDKDRYWGNCNSNTKYLAVKRKFTRY